MQETQESAFVERFMESQLLQAEWVLYFLIGVFVASTVVVLWKISFFVLNSMRARELRKRVAALVAGGDVAAFRSEVDELDGVEANVLQHALRYADNGSEVVDQQMSVALQQGKTRLELGLTFLGTVGANAPFVGLFGTVLGIIKAFRDLSLESAEGAQAVIGGISEALVATAVGLLVAIPAVVAYNYLQKQVKKVLNSSGALNQQVLFRLRSEG
jgi:biopolymer transport protein ExbB